MSSQKRPLLSIGMIVKNESRCLERCLDALAPLRKAISCELVIADTGSDDGTREIAARYADQVFDFPWINDFAAARNAVMDRCSGIWYLSLDADEYLDPDVKELVAFFHSDSAKQMESAFVVLNNYSSAQDKSQYAPFRAHRLLKMSTGLRFQGKIHECWPEAVSEMSLLLSHTVFWHDGYLNNSAVTSREKSLRNMELIKEELESDPDNLLRMLQAVESACTPKECRDYTRRMITLVKQGVNRADSLGAACYRHAVRNAARMHMPELGEWMREAFQRYPDSLYIQIDTRNLAMGLAQEEEDYQGMLDHGEMYLKGLARLDTWDLGPWDLQVGTIDGAGKVQREVAVLGMASAHAHMGDWEKCGTLLRRFAPETLSVGNVSSWLGLAFYAWEHVELSDVFVRAGEALYRDEPDGPEDELMLARRDAFTARAVAMFAYEREDEAEDADGPMEPAFPLLMCLGDCMLAHAATVMAAGNGGAAFAAAARIEKWDGVPIQVPIRLMHLAQPLPDGFYLQSMDELEHLAGALAVTAGEGFPAALPHWLKVEDGGEHIIRTSWLLSLTIAALRMLDWGKSGDEREILLHQFAALTEDYLQRVYHPSLLCEDGVCALRGMHRFGWYYLEFCRMWEMGNLVEGLRLLRKALEVAPVMKGMLDFLIKRLETEQVTRSASPELLELARQVKRQVEALRASGAPGLDALIQSAAYQKLKPLIEGMERA